MHTNELAALVNYNFWANERILSACRSISNGEFTQELPNDPGHGSLRGILAHALDAEYGWRCVMQARDATEILSAERFPDVAALSARWADERAAWLAFVADMDAGAPLRRIGDGAPGKLRVWQTIVHVVNHGTQHRGEAAAILTGYGHSPGELDFDLFLSDNPQTDG